MNINKDDLKLVSASELFDADWYSKKYPDVILSKIEPVAHYLQFGSILLRDPSEHFSSRGYYEQNKDVAENKINPLLHYLRYGETEGRTWFISLDKKKNAILDKCTWTSLDFLQGANIQANESEDYVWSATTDDPHFQLASPMILHTPGWKIIDITLQAPSDYVDAKLYLDTGLGFNESEAITFLLNNNRSLQRVFFVADSILNLRFDPTEQVGAFSILSFNIAAIDFQYVDEIMLLEIAIKNKLDSTENAQEIVQKETDKLASDFNEQLMSFYDKCFIPEREHNYSVWIKTYEKPSLPTEKEIEQLLNSFTCTPIISVVMPTYNVPDIYLKEAIESVINQSYPYWELCIADDASPKAHISTILQHYAQQDERIKYVIREKNGHISAASNSALEIATGEYIALMDHDDTLAEHALLYIAEAINNNPDAKVLYSDEDKIDEVGRRFDPHFKSDWNPDLFFSQNYVSHLGVYHAALLKEINGFRLGLEGSQDYDLLLRCLPQLQNNQIIHISKVLYHWRAIEGSTALEAGEKSYTTDAGIKALEDYFEVTNQADVKVTMGKVPNTYRVNYPIPKQSPLVSLLIPTRDMLELLEPCINSIINKSTYANYEIIILDNGSVKSETLAFFDDIQTTEKRVKVLQYDQPFNYSAINNFGVKHAKGSLIGLINNDIEVISPEWLTEMVSHALRPEIGCVGAKLYYEDDTLQHAGVILSIGGVAGHSHKAFPKDHYGYFSRLVLTQNLSAVTAACLLIRKEVFNQVQGLDEENLAVAFNDVDFCLKVREAGYKNLWTPYAELYHYESKSRGFEDTPEKQARFAKEVEFMKNKWDDELEYDPFYNENLTKAREDFSYNA